MDIHLIKTILKVTPQKRPEVSEILKHPFFEQKSEKEESMKQSTTHSEESCKPILQSLNESCNPHKMVEFQKLIKKEEEKELQKQHHKQTYPPFPFPKHQHKIGVGAIQDQIKPDRHSPSPQQRRSPFNHSRNSPFRHNRIDYKLTTGQPQYTINKTFKSSAYNSSKTGINYQPYPNTDRVHPHYNRNS